MLNRFCLALPGLAALVIAGCSGDTGEPPSIVGSWLATSWRKTSVADTSRSVNDLTDSGLLGLRFVATAGSAYTWTLEFPTDTGQVSGTYTLRDSTLTITTDGHNTSFTATVDATTLVIWEPLNVDFGNGLEPAINTYTFRRE